MEKVVLLQHKYQKIKNMSISDIEKKLYKPEEKKLPTLEGSEFGPNANQAQQGSGAPVTVDLWKEKQKGLTAEGKKGLKLALIGIGAIVLIAGVIYGIYKYRQTSFNEEMTSIAISGSEKVESGKFLTYDIKYDNQNRAALNNAILRVYYPENFKPENNTNFVSEGPTSGNFALGNINGKTSGQVRFNGRVYSPKGALMNIKVELSYTPSVFNSTFVAKDQFSVNVVSTPITLEIEAPQNISSGDAINYLVSYKNTGAEDFDNIRIKAEYPDGFTFSKSDPRTSEGNNIWYIGRLLAGQEGKIIVSGKLEGDRDQTKKFNVYVGTIENDVFVSYNDEYWDTKIAASPLSIVQTINDKQELVANAGDILRFVIMYKNEGSVGLRNVIAKEELNSPVLDYATLNMEGGYYDYKEKTIVWKAPDYKQFMSLAPGQSGTIRFDIKIKNSLPINNENDKNFVISSMAKIDSPDIPTPVEMNKIIAGNRIDIKVNSKLVLEEKGYYNDSIIPNSGPVPPKVNNETTYTIHWIARNVSNDVSEAKVESSLPTGVSYTGKVFPEDANFEYNERTNSISWNLGDMPAGTGIINSPKEIAFQIKIRPSISQLGKEVDILNKSTFSAKDLFTGESLVASVDKKNNILAEDPSLKNAQNVVPE